MGIFIVVHVDCLAQLCQITLLFSRVQVPLHFVRMAMAAYSCFGSRGVGGGGGVPKCQFNVS